MTLHHPHGQIYAYPYVAPRTQPLLDAGPPRTTSAPAGCSAPTSWTPSARDGSRVVLSGRALDGLRAVRRPLAGRGAPRARTATCPTCVALDDDERDELAEVYLRPAAAPRPLLRRRGRRADRAALHRRLAPGAGARRAATSRGCTCRSCRCCARPGKLKYLAGSESGVGGWVNDVPPERVAARLREVARDAADAARAVAADRSPSTSAPPPDGRVVGPRAGSTSSASTPTTTTGCACRSPCRSAPPSRSGCARTAPCACGPCRPASASRSPSTTSRPGTPGGLGGLRRRRLLGPASRPGTGGRRSTSSSTAAVPLGAGLSSSAALECAVAVALSDLSGLGLRGRRRRPRLGSPRSARSAENTIAQAPTGGMDQSASLRCTAGHAILLDCRDGSVEQVPFDLGRARTSRCWSSTPAPSTPWSTASTRERRAQLRAGRRRARCRQPARGARSTPWTRRWRGSSDPVRPAPGPARRHRDRAGPADGRPRCARTGSRRSGRCSTPRTRRCATTSRSPCAELDVAVETARGARRARAPG